MTTVELMAKLKKAAAYSSLPELPVIVMPDEPVSDPAEWLQDADSVALFYLETGEVESAYWIDGLGLPVRL